MVTITSHIFINIFQTVHFSAVKFPRSNEKNMSFLLIPKSPKVREKSEAIGLGTFNPWYMCLWNFLNFKFDLTCHNTWGLGSFEPHFSWNETVFWLKGQKQVSYYRWCMMRCYLLMVNQQYKEQIHRSLDTSNINFTYSSKVIIIWPAVSTLHISAPQSKNTESTFLITYKLLSFL